MASRNRYYPLAYNDEIQTLFSNVSACLSALASLNVVLSGAAASLFFLTRLLSNYTGQALDLQQAILDAQDLSNVHLTNISSTLAQTLTQLQESEDAVTTLIEQVTDNQDTLNAISNNISIIMSSIGETTDSIEFLNRQSLTSLTNINNTNRAILEVQKEIKTTIEEIDLRAKILSTIAETTFNLECPSITGGAYEATACEYDPLGVGPMVCEGLEFEAFDCEVGTLTPEE